MRVYAICADANIDDEKARILNFIRFKLSENGNVDMCFNQELSPDCAVIEAMLGNLVPLQRLFCENSTYKKELVFIEEYCSRIANDIRILDFSLHESVGMENRLIGELRNRLRLYRDAAFRKEMVRMYHEIIAPMMRGDGRGFHT
jgi:hypothetical protein